MQRPVLLIQDVLDLIRPMEVQVLGDGEVSVSRGTALGSTGGPETITFARDAGPEARARLRENRSGAAIVGPDWDTPEPGVVLFRVADPRLAFARVLRRLVPEPLSFVGIHPTACVSPEAMIDDGVAIGPFAVVGAARVGAGSVIATRATILDSVTVGRRVRVHEGAVIGTAGFGFIRNEAGALESFPQVGTVVLEDDSEVFPLANIDRGAMGTTRVGQGSRIDHHAHVSHGCVVGAQTLVCAHAVLGGGSAVGERSFLGVGALIKEKVRVGSDVTVGMGAVVIRDVADGATVAGVPARPIP